MKIKGKKRERGAKQKQKKPMAGRTERIRGPDEGGTKRQGKGGGFERKKKVRRGSALEKMKKGCAGKKNSRGRP